MDLQENSNPLAKDNPHSDSNTNNERNTINPPMAPVILEEDDNIVSAAIITLGDDSSNEGASDEMDSEEQTAVMLTDDDASLEVSSEEEISSSDGTIIYISEQRQRTTRVEEIHVDASTQEMITIEETRTEIETVVQVVAQASSRMIESNVEEDLLIDLEDEVHVERHVRIEDTYDETRRGSNSSLLDMEILDDWTMSSLGSNIQDGTTSQDVQAGEDVEGSFTASFLGKANHQPIEVSFNQPGTFSGISTGADQDSDDDAFESCESENEEEVEKLDGNARLFRGLKRKKWVGKELSTILDPATNKRVPMPTTYEGRKRILMDLLLHLTKIIFFIDIGVRRERIFALIPENFWLTHFTWTDTRELLEARDQEICINLLSRTKTVLEEWGMVNGFPRVPETRQDVKLARGEGQRLDRKFRVWNLLEQKTPKSDRWLRHIFLDFVDCFPGESILDPEFRRVAVQKVVLMTELCFEQPISIVQEFHDVKERRERMERLVCAQMRDVFDRIGKLGLVC